MNMIAATLNGVGLIVLTFVLWRLWLDQKEMQATNTDGDATYDTFVQLVLLGLIFGGLGLWIAWMLDPR